MHVFDKLKELLSKGALNDRDGSTDLAHHYLDQLADASAVKSLLANEAFKVLLGSMRSDLKARLEGLIASDPELRAMHLVLQRTAGREQAQRELEATLQNVLLDTESEEA